MLDRDQWRDFAAVTTSVAVLGIGVGSSLPLTSLVLTARGSGPQIVGWLADAAALGGVLATVFSPTVTRLFGRRLVMLTCVATASISVILLQYVDSLAGWAVLRAAFGAAMAPLFVLGEAWINTLPGDNVRGRVVAIYTTSFTLCQMLGPGLTELLAGIPQHAFLICGSVFLLGIPGIALARDGSQIAAVGTVTEKDALASWWSIVRRAPVILAGAGLFAAFDNIVLSFLPLFALDHGQSRGRALSAVVVVLIGDATMQFAAGWLADRLGRARVNWWGGVSLCLLLPLLPALVHVTGVWEVYLFLLGGIAGSLYTLAMMASGERFSGAALLRASGLIALTWSLTSSAGPAATGILMQHFGSSAMTVVLWLMALGFLWAARAETRLSAPRVPLAADVA